LREFLDGAILVDESAGSPGRTVRALFVALARECKLRMERGCRQYVAGRTRGRCLPELWERLPIESRKTTRRALVTGVNVSRAGNGVLSIRIVWRGGLVSERSIMVPVGTIRGTERERCLVERIRTLMCAGQTDIVIAEQLEQEGFTPCKGGRFTAEIVSKRRSEHQIRSGLGRLRRGDRPRRYTIIGMAQQLDIDPQWIYRGISKGEIEISKDSKYGCYLFPRTKAAVARMKQLKWAKCVRSSSVRRRARIKLSSRTVAGRQPEIWRPKTENLGCPKCTGLA
jgi:hypothetical protein